MQFTITRPDGRREVRQYTPYAVKQAGPQEWHAIDPRDGRLLARDFVSAEHLRQSCDSRTEHVRYVNEKE